MLSAIAEAGTISPRAKRKNGVRQPSSGPFPLHFASRTYIRSMPINRGRGAPPGQEKKRKRRKEGLIVALVGK